MLMFNRSLVKPVYYCYCCLQVYLLDYGLVYRFNPEGKHKEYKEDPKRKHDGTIEFTSRDAHNGVGKMC